MRIEIMTRNYKVEEVVKELLVKKLNKFDKYFDDEASAKVKLSYLGKDRYCMEISIDASGVSLIRSEATSDRMNENIDIILPRIERQILKYRSKISKKLKNTAFESPVIFSENDNIKSHDGKIVKVKRFNMSVTTVANAIEEMEMLGHNFYVFLNGDTNDISVVYKRMDGDYGLIEPEKE